jgi:putative ABC transport system permease protein
MTGTLAGDPKTKELRPDRSFSYRLLDKELAQLYRAEQQQKKIGGIFSSLSIFLACLGLFGLASFTVQQRTKESGLRRVLGASTANIVSLLTWNILRLVLVANVVALPIAYFTMYW